MVHEILTGDEESCGLVAIAREAGRPIVGKGSSAGLEDQYRRHRQRNDSAEVTRKSHKALHSCRKSIKEHLSFRAIENWSSFFV
jgi:hypothetical protein